MGNIVGHMYDLQYNLHAIHPPIKNLLFVAQVHIIVYI